MNGIGTTFYVITIYDTFLFLLSLSCFSFLDKEAMLQKLESRVSNWNVLSWHFEYPREDLCEFSSKSDQPFGLWRWHTNTHTHTYRYPRIDFNIFSQILTEYEKAHRCTFLLGGKFHIDFGYWFLDWGQWLISYWCISGFEDLNRSL